MSFMSVHPSGKAFRNLGASEFDGVFHKQSEDTNVLYGLYRSLKLMAEELSQPNPLKPPIAVFENGETTAPGADEWSRLPVNYALIPFAHHTSKCLQFLQLPPLREIRPNLI
ncbi:hypothetical protein BH09VER1_BH09VER1_47450 [soil metagenome]